MNNTLLGIPVVESRNVHWSAIYRTPDQIIVGEVGHLKHALAIADILRGMRSDARAIWLEANARIFGG